MPQVVDDVGGQELLVERMYLCLDAGRSTWDIDAQGHTNALIYDISTDGVISLPPTLLDRLRAELPEFDSQLGFDE